VSGPTIWRAGRLYDLRKPFLFAAVERVLDPGEHVFTSMDKRPITSSRMRPLEPDSDALVLDALRDIATTLYTEFPLRTLVRLDLRADQNGRLFVLEANPKPDLKAPSPTSTSLVAADLSRHAMTYDDLVQSVFANTIVRMLEAADGSAERLIRRIETCLPRSGVAS
jgi:D-alanine-D-alanine ligase